MKAVILAGGLGTRLAEETHMRPKPMIEIGGMPILWHIMKYFSVFGIDEFIICCGYKGYFIKEFFLNYSTMTSNFTVDLGDGSVKKYSSSSENWKVTLVNTGEQTQTGGRLKKVKEFLDEEDFFFTYGDGLTNCDLSAQLYFHRNHGKMATVLAAKASGRFGSLVINGDKVTQFVEKPDGDGSYVNAGFFILSKKCIDLIDDDQTIWEEKPLQTLVKSQQLMSFNHDGFWQPMDTLREKQMLEKIWMSGNVPWKKW